MASRADTSFQNATKVAWDRTSRWSLQTGSNLLKSIFSRKTLKEKQATVDIAGKVAATTLSLDISNFANIRPATPAGTVVDWSRRISKSQMEHIKVDSNRIAAKYMGKSVSELGEISVMAYRAEMERKNMTMIIKALTDTYKVNPPIANALVATDAPFNQNYLPLPAGNKANFTAKTFFEIIGYLDDAIGVNPYGQGKMENSLDSIKRVAIFSTKAWMYFNSVNSDIIGNRDYFGKPVVIDGYGKFMNFHETMIIVVPTEFMPAESALSKDATVGWVPTAAVTGFNSQKSAALIATNIVNTAMNQVFVLYPDAMDVREPEQFNEGPIAYREQTHSLERSLYGVTSLECIRIFDAPVIRLWATTPYVNYSLKP